MSNEDGHASPERNEAPANSEHLNIKVTDNNNEVFFKIKRSTKLEKLMNAFCERQGKSPSAVRFLFEGSRVQQTDTPDTVCFFFLSFPFRLLPFVPFTQGFSFWGGLRHHAILRKRTNQLLICSSKCKTVTPSRSIKNKSADTRPK